MGVNDHMFEFGNVLHKFDMFFNMFVVDFLFPVFEWFPSPELFPHCFFEIFECVEVCVDVDY